MKKILVSSDKSEVELSETMMAERIDMISDDTGSKYDSLNSNLPVIQRDIDPISIVINYIFSDAFMEDNIAKAEKGHFLEKPTNKNGGSNSDHQCEKKEKSPDTIDKDLRTDYLLANDYVGVSNEFVFFGFSMIGKSHEDKNQVCQDKCCVKVIKHDVIIASIADGVGNCVYSNDGAEIAVSTSMRFIENELSKSNDFSDDNLITVMKESMDKAYKAVESYAREFGNNMLQYCSTLTITILKGSNLFIAHAGDDGVIAINEKGFYGLITARHKGEEIASVYPLQSKTTWEFLKVKSVIGVILATDGVLDSFTRSSRENNRIFYPIIEPLTNIKEAHMEVAKKYYSIYKNYFSSTPYLDIVQDDRTFIAIINSSMMKFCEFPEFNLEQWFLDNKSKRIKEYRSLNPDQVVNDEIVERWVDKDKVLLNCLNDVIVKFQ